MKVTLDTLIVESEECNQFKYEYRMIITSPAKFDSDKLDLVRNGWNIERNSQLDELEKAKPELEVAIDLAEKFGKDAVLWEAYFRMGVYYKKSKNLVEAKKYLMKSVEVIDKLRNHIVGGEEAKKLFS